MRTPEDVARDADALVPWRRIWTIVSVAVALVVAALLWTGALFGGLA